MSRPAVRKVLRGFYQQSRHLFNSSFTSRVRRLPQARTQPPHSRLEARPAGSSFRSSNLLVAAAAGIVVGLVRPLDEELPEDIQRKVDEAWLRAADAHSIKPLREAAWFTVRSRLEYLFQGLIIDEGPLSCDLLITNGVHITSEDTRIFWVPSRDAHTTPTVCLAFNYAWRASNKDCSTISAEDAEKHNARFYAHVMEKTILRRLRKEVLEKWEKERGLERCLVLLDFPDVLSYFLYENGKWKILWPEDIWMEKDAILQ